MEEKYSTDFAGLAALCLDKSNGLLWPYPFSLPGWMSVWWQHFGAGYELQILTLRYEARIVGIAPFKRLGQAASFIGDPSVCDYLDFITLPGSEGLFAGLLLEECAEQGINSLNLETQRPDSSAVRYLLPAAIHRGIAACCVKAEESYEMPLPGNFEEYLAGLDAKQRHELLRKQRTMDMANAINFRMLGDNEISSRDIELFLSMMADSRRDKAGFLTKVMRAYFQDLIKAMSSAGLLRLGFLDLGAIPVAAILGFDYNNVMYLYNSGYDPAYADQSVGLLSKLASIRWAIERKKSVFDFLKGSEPYKKRLGGRQVNLSACRIELG
jgi:CelD/BcsL family acetyltransferase involved in cellulose biosynthesis